MYKPIIDLGVAICLIGVFIGAFGRKFFVLRWIFGDRSMFAQLLWGVILATIGLALMLLGGFPV
ncbi:hypothetical protein [Pediococcus pentosaceus]|uniref:hypothetical protein n=1 Tax=Pediococcus pentosaceus TaxID=1255 RepID=UPI0039826BA1